MSKGFEKYEKELRGVHLVFIGFSLLISYLGIRTWENNTPIRELDGLNRDIQSFNSNPHKLIYDLRRDRLPDEFNNIKDSISNAFQKSFDLNLNWGGKNNKEFVFFRVPHYSRITDTSKVENAVKAILNTTTVFYPTRFFGCKPQQSKNSLIPTNERIYSVASFDSIIQKTGSSYITMNVARLRMTKASNLNIMPGTAINVRCKCNISSLTFETIQIEEYLESKKWLRKNWEMIKYRTIGSFNELWRDEVKDKILGEKSKIIGIEIQNSSIGYVYIIFTLIFFIYVISHMLKVIKLSPSKTDYDFFWIGFFEDNWSKLLKIIVWLLVPFITSFLVAIVLIDNYLYLIFVLPFLYLGIKTYLISMRIDRWDPYRK
ncbi:hypothetical protein [Ulvibacterium sp.]|uniref:hypothetical protein n=1 Tax=Ulvibacterium sp. TaxID=2665914 RepID=UPI00263953D1|nr:hypothetical protein [Ulvibacterium sp.]